MSSDSMVARVNNLTEMEINFVRPFLPAALDSRLKLRAGANSSVNYPGDSQVDSTLNSSSARHSTFTESRLS